MDCYLPTDANIPKDSLGIYVLDQQKPEDVARAMITGQQREPFHLFDMDEAYNRITHFKQVMPRIRVFYAMKAFDYEGILKLAISQGLGFDCASPGEIKKIMQLNVDPLSIIYAMPTKTREQMIYARACGVKHTTFDSSYELKKIKHYWPDAELLIRIKINSDCTYKLGDKFGCDFENDAIDLLEEAASLGLRVVGVAFHVGSICLSLESYVTGIAQARMLFDHELRARRSMSMLDIGGGFLSQTTGCIDEAAVVINSALQKYFPDQSIQVIAEPGRYICDSSVALYSSICNVRKIKTNNNPATMIYMNEGVHGTLRYAESWHTVARFKTNPNMKTSEALEDVILWGPTCDSLDRVMESHTIRLPSCTPSDWLVVEALGAYALGFASKFSSLETPLMRSVVSRLIWKIIKGSPIFSATDFILKPNISAPLPSTLPSLPVVPDLKLRDLLSTAKLMTQDSDKIVEDSMPCPE